MTEGGTPPKIEVSFRKTEFPPSGLVESMLPPLILAITNAVLPQAANGFAPLPLKRGGRRALARCIAGKQLCLYRGYSDTKGKDNLVRACQR
jgi:hypothetical protein